MIFVPLQILVCTGKEPEARPKSDFANELSVIPASFVGDLTVDQNLWVEALNSIQTMQLEFAVFKDQYAILKKSPTQHSHF